MNLRLTGGKIPIDTGNDRHPIMLVDMPDRELFDSLFKYLRPAGKDKYWDILSERLSGKTMKEVASTRGVTKERVRQIEARITKRLREFLKERLGDAVAVE